MPGTSRFPSMRGPARSASVWLNPTRMALVLSLIVSCNDTSGPGGGNLRVVVTTTGEDVDVDGYEVVLTQRAPVPVGLDGVVVIADLAAGNRVVRLTGFAINCNTTDSNPRSVEIRQGRTVTVAFDVVCNTAAPIVFEATSTQDIFSIKANGDGLARLTFHPGWDGDPVWSPDRTRIAFASDRDGNREVYVMGATGSDPVNLTMSPGADHSPTWSPDGSRIAFVSDRDGNPEIHVMNADGSNPVRLTEHEANDIDPAWSPDGSRIAFASDRFLAIYNLYVIEADGTNLDRMTFSVDPHNQPTWSPDGTLLAYTARRCTSFGCDSKIRSASTAGPDMPGPISTPSGENATWSSDGAFIAVTGPDCHFVGDENFVVIGIECEPRGLRIVRLSALGGPQSEWLVAELTGTDAAGAAWRW